MKTHSRFNTARKFLIFWCLFIGIGAVGGAACMLLRPDGSIMGMQGMLPFFQVLPFAKVLFQDFVFPGIALLCVNGITNLTAAALLLAGKRSGVVCGGIFGVTLMAWITIQFVIFPFNVMSTSFFFFGLAQALTGFAAWVFREQEEFAAREEALPAPHHAQNLVVFFSRMGYTRALALKQARLTDADVMEIVTPERTAGTLGFWWCGRFAMHRWAMPINACTLDPAAYEHVTLCAPVWVFGLSAPVRAFCQTYAGRISAADYLLTHFCRFSFPGAAREMDRLLGIRATEVQSVCVRWGRVKSRRVESASAVCDA